MTTLPTFSRRDAQLVAAASCFPRTKGGRVLMPARVRNSFLRRLFGSTFANAERARRVSL